MPVDEEMMQAISFCMDEKLRPINAMLTALEHNYREQKAVSQDNREKLSTLTEISNKQAVEQAELCTTVSQHSTQQHELYQQLKLHHDKLERVMADQANLNGRIATIDSRCDKMEDSSLRSTLAFFGIARGQDERQWSDTSNTLATWLARYMGGTVDYHRKTIIRAHRGKRNPSKQGPAPIHCLFSWQAADDINRKLGFKLSDGVRVSQAYSTNTRERISKALDHRRDVKRSHPDWKMYSRYPATLMVKREGELQYSVLKTF